VSCLLHIRRVDLIVNHLSPLTPVSFTALFNVTLVQSVKSSVYPQHLRSTTFQFFFPTTTSFFHTAVLPQYVLKILRHILKVPASCIVRCRIINTRRTAVHISRGSRPSSTAFWRTVRIFGEVFLMRTLPYLLKKYRISQFWNGRRSEILGSLTDFHILERGETRRLNPTLYKSSSLPVSSTAVYNLQCVFLLHGSTRSCHSKDRQYVQTVAR